MKPTGRAKTDTEKKLAAFRRKGKAPKISAAQKKLLRLLDKGLHVKVEFGHGNVATFMLPGNFPRLRLRLELRRRYPKIHRAEVVCNGNKPIVFHYGKKVSVSNLDGRKAAADPATVLTAHREEGSFSNFDRYIAGDR